MTMAPLDPNQLPGIFGGGISVPAPKAGGGMFGNTPNWANAVQAAIGGYLAAGNNPAGQNILQNLFYQRQMAQRQALEEQQYQRRRSDDMTDWQAKQQWQLDHPAPINNDTVNDYNFFSQVLGPDAGKQYLQTKLNPIVMTPYGPMPYSAVTGPQQAQKPVGKLTPIEDGGPAALPPATFPRPY